ncbi:MAG TPA: hypothetical protein DD435_01060 [Cyanobacteria bacterium UBA8530]|nr:hypothetical protein [Cyanobacteria bacterium UBA8530]
MAGIPGCAPRRYTIQEKIALVTEIERRHRASNGTLRSIAAALGTTETTYQNWIRAGIMPSPLLADVSPAPAAQKRYKQIERLQLLAEVEHLRDEGHGLLSACRVVGISGKSFHRWKGLAASPPAMRPVEFTAMVPILPVITSKPVIETLTLIAPGGYRIEGMSIESAASLLRALE